MKVQVEVTDERINDLLCSAFEGGSNYWYIITAQKAIDGVLFVHEYPLAGGWLRLGLLDDTHVNGRKSWFVDRFTIEQGLGVFAHKYPQHFGNWLDENDDATTGDVFLQCICFGEAVFG